MAVSVPHRKMTADEFFALPDELPHTQLIDGELVMNSPRAWHQRVIMWLGHRFLQHAETHPRCGELGMELDTPIDVHNVYKPDLWWLPADRLLAHEDNRHGEPPPLVVEVRSPSTWRDDVGTKLRHYEDAGVLEVWLIDDRSQAVTVLRRTSPDAAAFDDQRELHPGDVLTTPLVPEWEVDVAEIFDR